ncbi:rhombosortase [Vibrio sp. JC009]|uniref:rhombosortase n=1 Tax=Vibrio sp. JC009 TaxID=2912314 RepID=UPI0023AE7C90|nr:rhombosortase [Vibrio sp. JC009]WED22600.1 rhombosortase [Vibrio sp. JC009]
MNLYIFLIIVTFISGLLQIPALQSLTIWNADLIQSGQLWRVISGNFTHTNLYHLLMNMAALWVMGFLFKPSAKSLLSLLVLLSAVVGCALLATEIDIYAGLSGTLHGLFAFYAAIEVSRGLRSSWLLILGVIAKVGYEQVFGAQESTAKLIEASVAIDAHLAGCIAGVIAATAVISYRKLAR